MKKQLLLIAACLVAVTNIQAYLFYVINAGDFPIYADWYTKVGGRAGHSNGRFDYQKLIQPGHYAAFYDSGGLCSKEVWILDARRQADPGDTLQNPYKFTDFKMGAAVNTTCHQHQILKVFTPLTDSSKNKTQEYYNIYGKQHSGFQVQYWAYLPTESSQADSVLANYTRTPDDQANVPNT